MVTVYNIYRMFIVYTAFKILVLNGRFFHRSTIIYKSKKSQTNKQLIKQFVVFKKTKGNKYRQQPDEYCTMHIKLILVVLDFFT